ncbi:MAG TPA: 2-oxoacid:acceptor oxidoreductase family protein, partial [Candidatus Krumholzibacteria bacterium]|nr:2-oxoacid:acceptor oxidoreductase family protein [Candidatus Krumholzibacteria bacterium]
MWFRKPDSGAKQYPFAGTPGVLTGYDAVLDAEGVAGDVLVVPPADDADALLSSSAPAAGNGARTATSLDVREAGVGEAPALLSGLALEGIRAAAVMDSLGAGAGNLAAAAGKRLAFVIHLIARSRTRQAASPNGSHDDYYAAADTGAFLMFASNAQEAADFTLIAHRVAEQSLTPGVCAQDLYHTGHSVQNLNRPDAKLSIEFLGRSTDTIASPTDAQSILFGAERRRIPVLLDIDHPAGVGGAQDRESYFRAVAAQRPFFAGHLPSIVDDAMRAFGEHTGRVYQRVSGYRVDDAEFVIVGQGAVMEDLAEVVDTLRRERRLKVGLVNVSVLRPFAGAALSHLLMGKRAVAVIERTDAPLSEILPLFGEVSAAIDRATENGQSAAAAPYPGYAVLKTLADRPRLYSGVYGVGAEMPSFGELASVFEHMQKNTGARRFFVGARFDTETRRFPHLESLQQRLGRAYPDASALDLPASLLRPVPVADSAAFELRSLSVQGGMFATNLFAQALCATPGWNVRTFPEGGLERNLQPSSVRVAFAADSAAVRARPADVGAVLISGEQLVESLPVESVLRGGGVLVIGSVQEPQAWWRSLSRRTANWIRSGELRVYLIDARKIATETAAHASFIDQLATWSLLGAYARVAPALPRSVTDHLGDELRAHLADALGSDTASIDAIVRSFVRGGEDVRDVPWASWTDTVHALGEPDAPWTVRGAAQSDGTVFDPVRFWNSVGYLYDRGQSALTLADPYLATGVMPARSSAFRDMSRYRLRIPEWIPSACTGCADCWAQCPESALPSTVRSVAELMDASMHACEQTGPALVQMKRMAEALSKQAYKLAVQSGPQPYETWSGILTDAFARVVEKAGLTGEKFDALKAEFDRVCAAVDGLPVAVTDRFFSTPQSAAAGTGRLLSIAINPLSCTACGVCVATCPEGAISWSEQTPERLERTRRDWEFLMHLPAPSGVSEMVRDDDADTEPLRLLDPVVYHSLVGGDGSFPGNSARTAVHLVTATIESEMRARYTAHVDRLTRLIERLEQRIQGTVDATAKINDFEEFGQRLSRVTGDAITPDVLRSLASDAPESQAVDAAALARWTDLLHALRAQRRSYTEGDGRARILLAIEPAWSALWNRTYPCNPHPQPWVSQLSGDAAALARGVCEGVVRRLGAEFAICRRAEQELDGHAAETIPSVPGWNEFTAEERRLVPTVLVIADATGADATAVASVLDTGLPIRVMLVDRDGAAVDGGASGNDLARIHQNGAAFVMQSSIGYAGHLMRGVAESLRRDGPALYRIYAPDAVRDGLPAEDVVAVARLAVDGRVVPLCVWRPDGDGRGLSLQGNPDAGSAWPSHELTVREPSGAESRVKTAVTPADWASRQARFRRHFTVMSKGHRGAH